MRTVVTLMALSIVAFACAPKTVEEPTAPEETVAIPLEYTYKGTAAVGKMKNVQVVAECSKRVSELNPDVGEFLADSVHWIMSDGMEINASRDSALVVLKGFLGSLTSMKVVYITQVAVDNVDAKHEWVFSWSDETYTFKDGTVEHAALHEDFRLENGKIREILQYARPTVAMKP
ncbi:MAG TPA: hypothetical protein VK658_25115 [Chryseolinea sp.]|nr:hypothetical protein [Chryseolinea sp.]